ncbi:MAG: protein-glutamate O-methyltransferase family protein [Chloroflexi bacterium]|nr:protein-glutamate O-methyltransferase family protein [Chloroflexota bacterium]
MPDINEAKEPCQSSKHLGICRRNRYNAMFMDTKEHLPPQARGNDPASFAAYTMQERLPSILEQVLRDNPYPQSVHAHLQAFRDELAEGFPQPFLDAGPDTPYWHAQWGRWGVVAWQELPWFLAETWFYRRILYETGYYTAGPSQYHDPFFVVKQRALQEGLIQLADILPTVPSGFNEAALRAWLRISLWGNQADFSNQAALASATSQKGSEGRVLVDDGTAIWGYLEAQSEPKIDIICDNAGYELLNDLALADWLLQAGTARRLRLHLKAQPYYVSDAMPKDVLASVAALRTSAVSELASLGARLDTALHEERLELRNHLFWTTAETAFHLPDELVKTLAQADLLLFKGDVNYRRLADDRYWPHEMPFAALANRVPRPYAALRAIKSEIVCGLALGVDERVAAQDPGWLTEGRWGVIQFSQGEQ